MHQFSHNQAVWMKMAGLYLILNCTWEVSFDKENLLDVFHFDDLTFFTALSCSFLGVCDCFFLIPN